MSIEVRPLGVKCNLRCLYCYQNPERDADNVLNSYNMEKMKANLEKEGGSFTVFGGEPLLIPEKDLEELWSWGLSRFGKNGIQTNGVLINDNHIHMFKKYKVNVGISVDGPGELNDARWNGTLERTRQATIKTNAAIEQLAKENVNLSLIVTLHRGNATRDKLPAMYKWFNCLDNLGVRNLRLHLLEVETDEIRKKLMLSDEENLEAFVGFHELSNKLNTLKIDVFSDMFDMLLGQDKKATCIWTGCDSYTTSAVRGIEGNGQSSNCTRTNKDGIDFVKCCTEGFERYLALYYTPQNSGGCQGCRFFLMCKGHCPGTAIDGDWRNKTEYCGLWEKLFTGFEKQMLDRGQTPLSLNPHREVIENCMINGWSNGLKLFIADILNEIKKFNKGSTSIEEKLAEYVEKKLRNIKRSDELYSKSCHGDAPHGDKPHGDHADHGDS